MNDPTTHMHSIDDSSEEKNNSSVLVMGGSGIIGGAVCLRFAKANWNVGIHYHRHELAARTTYSHFPHKGEEGSLFQADARNLKQVEHLIQRFQANWGKLDALIWTIGQANNTLAVRLSSEEWDDLIQANLTSLFYCLRTVGPVFQDQGFGSIVVLSSLASTIGTTGQAGYAATKAGVLGLVRSVAQEWGASNIRVNTVFPGWHQSALSGDTFPHPESCHDHLLARTPNLQDTANQIYHLATAKDISGQIFNLDSRIW